MSDQNHFTPEMPLPGTALHQALLATITNLYRDDARVSALVLFGSLARNDWDTYSDLDLAVILQQNVEITLDIEVEAVQDAVLGSHEPVLFTQAAGDTGYLLLRSLNGIAISYHPLQATEPGILDGMRVLCGALPVATIRAAAQANAHTPAAPDVEMHRVLWLALDADIKLQRREFWNALPTVNRIRDALIGMFAAAHNGHRAYRVFAAEASPALQDAFGRTLPHYQSDDPAGAIRALSTALEQLLGLIESDLNTLSGGQVQLGEGEQETIRLLRARQAALLAKL